MLPLFISVRFVPFKPCIFYLPRSFMDQLISRIGYPFDIGGSSALVIEKMPLPECPNRVIPLLQPECFYTFTQNPRLPLGFSDDECRDCRQSSMDI